MKKGTISLIACMSILSFAVTPSLADPINPRTILEGTIQNVDNNGIVVDSAVDDQGDVRLEVDQDTLFKQADSLEDLEEGDAVMVSFREENQKKVAVYIAKVYPVSNYVPPQHRKDAATINAGSIPVDDIERPSSAEF